MCLSEWVSLRGVWWSRGEGLVLSRLWMFEAVRAELVVTASEQTPRKMIPEQPGVQ